MQEIEGAQHYAALAAGGQVLLQQGELGKAFAVTRYQLAVDQRGLGAQLADGFCHARKFPGPVQPFAGHQLDIAAVQPRLNAIAVKLDLVFPTAIVGHPGDQRGKTGFDESD
jgi:hypothetical protein